MAILPPEAMTVIDAIDGYAMAHSDPVPPLLQELERETRATMPVPDMQVGGIEGAFLRMLVRLVGARRVVELGTFTGGSALYMAEGLPEGGELVTCEIDAAVAGVARRYFARSPHGGRIQLRVGPALETLASLEGPFDLAFVDADKEGYPAYYEALLPLLRTGGLLVVDNALWGGGVLDPEDPSARAIASVNDRAAADPRVDRVLLTVRDGVLLVRKR